MCACVFVDVFECVCSAMERAEELLVGRDNWALCRWHDPAVCSRKAQS